MIDARSNGIASIAAHRGWHADGAHENGIAALERAAAKGVDKVELDVRRLGDGTLIVHHDPTLDGVPLERLDQRALLAHGDDVPTLDAWARRTRGLDVGALVELKEAGYERQVLDTLRRNLPDSRLELMSFEPDAVRALRALAPDRPVGLLTDVKTHAGDGARIVREARALGASFVGLNVDQATDDVLRHVAGAGLDAAVWTVNEPARIAQLLGDGRVGTVITDAPRHALEARRLLTGGGVAKLANAADGPLLTTLRAVATMR